MIGNHLLQSTLFALAAGLLTLLLRNNQARARYWIWLAASLKFLVSFSFFVELGHRVSCSSGPAIRFSLNVFISRLIRRAGMSPCIR